MTVLRAISLAAVTTLVCSTRLKPCSAAHRRTSWRTRRQSSSLRTGMVSCLRTAIATPPPPIERPSPDGSVEDVQALLDVQGGADSLEREAQLHEGDGDRRPHADHHRLRIEDAGHAGDVPQHPPDEGVDHFQGRYVDEDAPGPALHDLLRQVVLQAERQPVVHVHLDGDEEATSDLQDWDAFHRFSGSSSTFPAAPGALTIARPVLARAMAKASARVALVVTSERSRPRWTMVCAIWGRMPLMMQSAPMSRAAATVFRRCWATMVSTIGTPVISMMAMEAPVSTIFWRRFSMTTCVRALSRVPMIGSPRIPSQSSTTGVDSSCRSLCCRVITSSRPFWKT